MLQMTLVFHVLSGPEEKRFPFFLRHFLMTEIPIQTSGLCPTRVLISVFWFNPFYLLFGLGTFTFNLRHASLNILHLNKNMEFK